MTVVQRSPNIGLAIRMQRVATAPAAAPSTDGGGGPIPGDPQPPVWARWFDDEDAPATDIRVETFVAAGGYTQGWFAEGPMVACVAGGVEVEWDVTFVPTLWDTGGTVIWEGAALTSNLPLAVAPGDDPMPPTRSFMLPDFGDVVPTMYWPHQWRDFDFGTVYEPCMVAAGNTLSVVPELGSCPGVLEATAKIGATVLGTVRLTVYLEVTIPE